MDGFVPETLNDLDNTGDQTKCWLDKVKADSQPSTGNQDTAYSTPA